MFHTGDLCQHFLIKEPFYILFIYLFLYNYLIIVYFIQDILIIFISLPHPYPYKFLPLDLMRSVIYVKAY